MYYFYENFSTLSHFKIRKENNCLNCGSIVQGRFCGQCGQENIAPRESVWHLVTHFFYDITHFDGKFFSALRFLIFKPGFLTAEYVKGRRASYLHPIRMYVFTSAFFFLIYFTFFGGHSEQTKERQKGLKEELAIKEEGLQGLREILMKSSDTTLRAAASKTKAQYEKDISKLKDSLRMQEAADAAGERQKVLHDSVILGLPGNIQPILDSAQAQTGNESNEKGFEINAESVEWFRNEETYRAVQENLPRNKRNGLITRAITEKLLHWHGQEETGDQKSMEVLMDKFKHSFPALLFVSLPLFALLLKMLYVRRKRFYYVDHGIFTIHTYCALFILMLLFYLLDSAYTKWHWWIFSILRSGVILYMFYYVYRAMRNFYGQGRLKTLLKYFLLSWMTLLGMTFLIIIFFIISAYKV